MLKDYQKPEQIKKWYIQFGPMVLRRCRKILADEEHARDAMHDVFTKMLAAGRFRNIHNMGKYLYRVATHVCIDFIRAQKHRCHESEDQLKTIACHDDSEQQTILRLLLNKIFYKERDSTREMAVMVYVEGMTYEEAALALDISPSTIKKRLRKLRLSTAAIMENNHDK